MSPSAPYSDENLDALFALARAAAPDTSAAEYGFETRLMAQLRERRRAGSIPLLGSLSWRLMPAFAVIALVLVFWHERVAADVSDAAQLSWFQNVDGGDVDYNLK